MRKKLVLILSATLIAFAISGCSKKPRRPNPIDTMYGPGGSGSGSMIDPTGVGENGTFITGEGLETRGASADWSINARRGVLPTVYFSFDSSSILPQERAKLNQAADYLRENPRAKLVLEGHCDWRGTAEYNLALGERRAQSALKYLETLGISGSRLQTLTKGDQEAAEGGSSAQMAKDRKVEVLIAD